jgi:protein-S-isoprenylcysteine O-methyltransferase Ste14
MSELNKKAFEGLAQFMLTLSTLLFLPAWTVYYVQAWAFLVVFGGCVLAITVYLMRKDPALLARRMVAGPSGEKEKMQKIIQSFAAVAFVSIFLTSSLDHRFMWSTIPIYINLFGDVLVALGLLGVFLVFKENTFTAGTVQVETEQKLVSSGPYAIIRHPMYAAAFVMLVGVPLALDSLWGLMPVAIIMVVIVLRLFDEEKLLLEELPGYKEYSARVKCRLIPYIW